MGKKRNEEQKIWKPKKVNDNLKLLHKSIRSISPVKELILRITTLKEGLLKRRKSARN